MKLLYFILLPLICVACSRTHYIGEEYLGKPYLLDPLGEESAPDTDPLIRFDAFDCTTFVETALADGAVDKLTKIRYKNGKIGFINRNHFIETEWLPNNADLVNNISAQYGKTAIRKVTIKRAKWMKLVHNVIDTTPDKTVDLEYIPYNNFDTIQTDNPLIVLFVLTGDPKFIKKTGTELAVHHMGFLLPNGMLRHASSSGGGVVDVRFDEYVAKRKKMPNNIGIILLEIKQNDSRR